MTCKKVPPRTRVKMLKRVREQTKDNSVTQEAYGGRDGLYSGGWRLQRDVQFRVLEDKIVEEGSTITTQYTCTIVRYNFKAGEAASWSGGVEE